jgi:clan AA aspartic protease (TIGR02281 family)
MARLLTLIASLCSVPLLTLAALALAGVATVRHPEPVSVALATTCLLALPVLGFTALTPSRRVGLLLGANLWPVLLLTGLPLYFPGERMEAIDRGLALLGIPLGGALPVEQRRALAQTIDTILAEPSARQPAPIAAPSIDAPPPPSRLEAGGDQVALPYEGRGHSLLIPIVLEGPDGRIVETEMLFDTGATYTTLDPETLRRLGYRLPPDAPRIDFQTANGASSAQLAVLDRVWLGGIEVSGVTVAVCDSCNAGGDHSGLLGLNVSSRFLITLDTARRELLFEPRSAGRADHLDVRPWLDLEGRGRSWPDGRTEVEISATNLGGRPMGRASVEVSCAGERFELPVGPFEPHETIEATATIPPPHDCDPFTIDLASGAW